MLPEGLAAKGWTVEVVEAYRTEVARPDPAALKAAADAHAVTFTSSSTVTNFVAVAPGVVPPFVACIGPVTAATARAAGFHGRRGRRRAQHRRAGRRPGFGPRRSTVVVTPMAFPERRMRRLRRTPALRRMVAETKLSVDDLIAPLFVREGIDLPCPISSLPGVVQHTRDSLLKEAQRLSYLGVPAVVLFGVPAFKDPVGSEAWNPDGIVQLALSDLKDELGDSMVVIADLCLDEYTDHGHCGVVDDRGEVDNDATLELYQRVALAQATAGADIVAPSGMMDGQVGAIRHALDGSGFAEVAILAYAAKYASALYGPFRDAVDVQIAGGGNRKGYQQDPRNRREALTEVALDVAEGADMVMVKPALAYLDVIREVRQLVNQPVAAYHVSGEYAMIKAAAANGWIDGEAVALEHLTAIKRAGADLILTYLAGEVAETLDG